MAFIKFSNYGQLNTAEVNAAAELAAEIVKSVEGSYNIKYAQERYDHIKGLLDLYDFDRSGGIYIDRHDVNMIKRFTENEDY